GSLRAPQPFMFSRFRPLFVFARMAAWLSTALAASPLEAAPRVPWTSSHVVGTPEPPKPFVSEHVFPALSFTEPVELIAVPGSDRFLIVERRGKISSFAARDGGASADEVMDLLPSHPTL